MADIYIVLGVVAIILIIIILVIVAGRKRHRHDHKREVKTPKVNVISQDKINRTKVQNGKPSNFKVMSNKPVEIGQNRNMANSENKEFPRHEAKGVLKQHSSQVVQNAKPVSVSTIADLFSPKIDYVSEYGVTKEELEKMVEEYSESREYKERALPINKNFSLDKYTSVQDSMRQSMRRTGEMHGDKKGIIMTEIYKKFGKESLKPKGPVLYGGVDALNISHKQHEEAKVHAKGKSSTGNLVAY